MILNRSAQWSMIFLLAIITNALLLLAIFRGIPIIRATAYRFPFLAFGTNKNLIFYC